MAVRLRLHRMGKKKQPYYRIVAIDSRTARDGKYLESLGTYNPRTEPTTLQIVEERALYWLDRGAKPSDTVQTLLSRQGILLRRHLKSLGADETKLHEETQKWEALQVDKQKRREAVKAQHKLKAKAKPAETAPVESAAAESAPAETPAASSTEGAALDASMPQP